ncbi:glycine oxidase ThiO [Stappia sp.]|uniref:glycine oxidase ThiO n=1 Tax=Stappia sp. TaxID=1870903 RepID=UPI0032D94113
MKVSVIGGGVTGLACATALQEAGHEVTLFDRGTPGGAQTCSWWAGGMLAPFCEGEAAEEPVVRLGAEALAWWAARVDGVARKGSLVLAQPRDGADLRRFARRTQAHAPVDGDAIAELEPDLAGRFRQGLFFAGEGHVDPRAALAGLVARLTERGAAIRPETEIDPAEAPGDAVLDCRGFAARGEIAELRGVKGEMLVIRSPDVALSRPVRLLHPRIPLYVVPRGEGVFMVGATMVESDERTRITARAMLELLGAAYALHPAFAEAEVLEIGVDVRPAFPDNLPRVLREGRVLRVNGTYRHGFLLAPALAAQAASLLDTPDARPEFLHVPHRERCPA